MIRLGFWLAVSAQPPQFSYTRLRQEIGYLQNWISDSAKAEHPALDLVSIYVHAITKTVSVSFYILSKKRKFFFFALMNLRCSTGASLVAAHRLSCPVARGILVLHWCYPTMSSFVSAFSICLQSFPASGSVPMSAVGIKWPKSWSFSFSSSPSNEYSGLISFKIAWFDLLAVQGTLKSLLQQHSSKASVLLCLLYDPAITFIHNYWKDHSLDYIDLCWQKSI